MATEQELGAPVLPSLTPTFLSPAATSHWENLTGGEGRASWVMQITEFSSGSLAGSLKCGGGQ